ncbi:hypothetical protein BN946_scf184938.g30 [Trametes cinnabarina]|uniref:Uncharacterized protein n=1 Tax=Pycnoporus cinnabarinus TaxID=5643 RepID=A0A060S714_PYCCI|nr:hypothetical protein BN946_scf184938.g30 [Trametes cinnabarina]
MSAKPNGYLHVNDAERSPDTPASYYYGEDDLHPPEPEEIEEKLRTVGSVGAVAARVVDRVAREAQERREMIGGVDHLWIMLQDVTDFNPQLTRQAEKFPRYRQRLDSTGKLLRGAVFVDDPEFNVYNHIRLRRLPEPAGKRELDALVGDFIAEPWDLSRPLWDMILVENYHDDDDAVCAVVARGHHTLSDGQGFVISQLYLTSYYDDLRDMMDGAATKLHKAKRGQLLPSEYSGQLKPLDPYARDHFAASLIQVFLGLLFWLTTLGSTLVSLFWSTYQALRMIFFLLFTFWRIEMVVDETPDEQRRSAKRDPISIRAPGDWSMRNLSTGSNVYLPPSPNLTPAISVREIHAHIHRCRYELSLFKHSLLPRLCFHFLQLSGQAPVLNPLSWFPKSREDRLLVRVMRRWLIKPIVDACLESFTAILTNIPGPAKKPITMAGVEVAKLVALPPQGGAGTIGMGIISYAGGICIAVSADMVPGSEGVARRICENFERRFELYVERAKEVLEHQD